MPKEELVPSQDNKFRRQLAGIVYKRAVAEAREAGIDSSGNKMKEKI